MIETLHVRCHYGKDSYYALTVWTQGKMDVLAGSVLVLWPRGAPLWSEMGDNL